MRFDHKPPEWKPHFAWLPVQVGRQTVWLEWVERLTRISSHDYGEYHEYRLPKQTAA